MTLSDKCRGRLLWASAVAVIAGFAVPSASLRAQAQAQAQQDTTFSTDVNVVNVFATVRNKGKLVNSLAADDFVLEEDGRPQTIKYFSQETDLPLTLGLLVDTSMSQRNVLGQEKDASYRFLDEVLRPEEDLTFIMHFDHDSELLQDVTQSRPLLRKALDAVQLPDDSRPQMRQAGQGGGYPTNGNVRRAGTTLYDAIFLGSDEIMSRQHGRKALILLTDGVDEGSKTSMYEAIRAAQKSDTLVYSILFSDRDAYGQQQIVPMLGGMGRRRGMPMPPMSNAQHPDGKKVLQQISRETGGGFFEVSKKESIDDIYREIQEELRNQYSIGYVSDQGTNSATFRRISLTAKDKALTVQAPEGYYPVGK